MRKLYLYILGIFLILPFAIQAQTEKRIKIACVGNSITEGFLLKNPSEESYPAALQKLLGNNYEVGNFGVTAHTLSLKGDLPYMKTTRFQEALDFLPNIVTIKLGTNDSKPQNWQHRATFKDDLNLLIDKFQALASHPRIYLCLPIPSNRKEWGINDSIIVNGIIPYIREVAAERSLPVIDLHTAMLPYYPQLYVDGVHPDKYGAAIIAETLYKCITGEEPHPTPGRSDQTLWYDEPAAQWEETLPLGNGRLGMMPDGGIGKEHIVLNEISMWSGSEANYLNPDASKSLPEIRRLLFEGKNKEAQELMYTSFVPKKPEKGGTYGAFQMLGDLFLEHQYGVHEKDVPSDYRRWLDLSKGIAYTTFSRGNVSHVREYVVSRDKDVMLIHLKANVPGSINFKMNLNRPERGSVRKLAEGKLELYGSLDSGSSQAGVRYAAIAGITCKGRQTNQSTDEQSITVQNADEAWIVVSAKTSFLAGEIYETEADRILNDALKSNLCETVSEAILSYQALFNRAGIRLPENEAVSHLTTDQRIERFQQQDDPSLAALYYNYGRYLLISSTRPGSLPPNLQGLWANEPGTPWNGDYHTNINVQMNHWPVEQANLSELYLPLVDLVKRLVPSGEESAKAFYGPQAKGWVLHMMTNVWNYTAPGEHPSWGATNTGGAWLCAHLWEHYLFSGDRNYLADIYPIMKGASEFFYSTMVREPKHGWLVTAPTSSPENAFYLPGKDRTPISVCMGPTMDIQLVHELYTNVIEASHILHTDTAYAEALQEAIGLLPPHQISKKGYLMEWLEDYEETDIHHRHVSHLYGLHPGNQISVLKTPELAEACRKTLNRRGDEGTGWSRAWKINFWARLGDGNRAYKLFRSLLYPAYTAQNPTQHGSGTFPNLFCSHPPFQMDGNWGGTSGISEMLLQSQDGFIHLLPALPDSWKDGSFYGLKVRGGATVDLVWKDGKPVQATITGGWQNNLKMKWPQGVKKVLLNDTTCRTDSFIPFTVKQGECITFIFE